MKTSLVFACSLLTVVKFAQAGKYDQLGRDIEFFFGEFMQFLEIDEEKKLCTELQSSLLEKVKELNKDNAPQLSFEEVQNQLNAIVDAQKSDNLANFVNQKEKIKNELGKLVNYLKDTLEHPEKLQDQSTLIVTQKPVENAQNAALYEDLCKKHVPNKVSEVLYHHKGGYLLKSQTDGLVICITNEDNNSLRSLDESLTSLINENEKIRSKIIKIWDKPYMPKLKYLVGSIELNYFVYKIDANSVLTVDNQKWIKANMKAFIEKYFNAVAKMHQMMYHICVTSFSNILMNPTNNYVFFADFGLFKVNYEHPDCPKKATKPGQVEPFGHDAVYEAQKFNYEERISALTLLELLCEILMCGKDDLNKHLYGTDGEFTKMLNVKNLFEPVGFDIFDLELILRQAGFLQDDNLTFSQRTKLFNDGTLSAKYKADAVKRYLGDKATAVKEKLGSISSGAGDLAEKIGYGVLVGGAAALKVLGRFGRGGHHHGGSYFGGGGGYYSRGYRFRLDI